MRKSKGKKMLSNKRIGKQNILCIVFFIIVMIMCFLFAVEYPCGINDIESQLLSITEDDFEVVIIDEETVQLENLIKADGMSYTWDIVNTRNGEQITSSGLLALEENDIIEFSYEELSELKFEAVVVYDGVQYTSNQFSISAEGTVSRTSDEDTFTYETVDVITRDISDIVSLAYIMFLIVVVLLYYIVPKKIQWTVLLGASVFFYTLSGLHYILFILFSSWITYITARKISMEKVIADGYLKDASSMKEKKQIKAELQKVNSHIRLIGLIGSLGVLGIIKYSAFVIKNINTLTNIGIPVISLLMPLGLSFYTFMLIAYLIDVYRGKYLAEEKFTRFFLFISFFPHVSQGPISRYDEVAPQLTSYRKFNLNNLCLASQRILWGFFIKLVLADRLAILVSAVYDNYEAHSWAMLIIASLAYSIQIYADFYACMEIAIGSAQTFGIKLSENFLRPYFATSMPEFWRRWHATLGTWFKEYVFYPISISKRIMKLSVETRKKWGPNTARIIAAIPPIMGVWILTGLWHGSSWKYVAWGVFHGLLILMSTAFSGNVERILTKIGIKTESWDYKILQMFKVFILCTIGRVFFRAGSLTIALKIFWNTLTLVNPGKLIDFTTIGLEALDYKVIGISVLILLGVSTIQEKRGSARSVIAEANIWIRWILWISLVLAILVLGVYGLGTTPIFIYEGF